MPQVKKNEIKEIILREAALEFMEKGFKDSSIRKIAERGGISKSNLYTYFESKDRLFVELVQPAITKIDNYFKFIDRPENFDEEAYGLDYHISMIEDLADFIEENRTRLTLIIFKSFGSSLENYYNSLIGRYTAIFIRSIPYYAEKMNFKNRNVSKFFLHGLASSHAGFIKEILMHKVQKEDIIKYGREFMTHSYCGNAYLFGYEEFIKKDLDKL